MKDRVRILINLDQSLMSKIDRIADKEGNPRLTIIRRALAEFVNKNKLLS